MLLDPQVIATAAVAAYHAKTLCAQKVLPPSPTNGPNAFYIDPDQPGIGCAIGVGLPASEATVAQNARGGYSISRLVNTLGLFSVAEPIHLTRLAMMQKVHDQWVGGQGGNIERLFIAYATALAADTITPSIDAVMENVSWSWQPHMIEIALGQLAPAPTPD